MLRPRKKRESLAGKLLLSSALVALSLAYARWQRNPVPGPSLAVAPMVKPPVLDRSVPILPNVTMAPAAQPVTPRVDVARDEKAVARRDSVAPPSQKPLA